MSVVCVFKVLIPVADLWPATVARLHWSGGTKPDFVVFRFYCGHLKYLGIFQESPLGCTLLLLFDTPDSYCVNVLCLCTYMYVCMIMPNK